MAFLVYGIAYKNPETGEILLADIKCNVKSSSNKDISEETFMQASIKATRLLRKGMSPEDFLESYKTFINEDEM